MVGAAFSDPREKPLEETRRSHQNQGNEQSSSPHCWCCAGRGGGGEVMLKDMLDHSLSFASPQNCSSFAFEPGSLGQGVSSSQRDVSTFNAPDSTDLSAERGPRCLFHEGWTRCGGPGSG